MKKNILMILLAFVLLIAAACDQISSPSEYASDPLVSERGTSLQILMSDDLQPLEPIVSEYLGTREDGTSIQITYEGISKIRNILQSSDCIYDAVWLSSSVHLNMVSGGQKLSNTGFTCVSPVVFAVKESKAIELNLTGELSVSDIVLAVSSGNLSFVIPNVTQTNSGLTAYLGLVSGLSGNPTVLSREHLKNPKLQEDLISLFSAVERSSGSDQFVTELLMDQRYDCTVSSEATMIQLNRELEAAGKETMRLLYPLGGVTINDYPLVYINKGEAEKLEAFLDFQNFVMGEKGREFLVNLGMRIDFGGLIAPEHYDIFKEEWGIKTKEYISSIVYPRQDFVIESLDFYLTLFRKPSFTVFCLDFSGSMGWNSGYEQLMEAMDYILSPEKAGQDFIQFTEKDKIAIVVFNSDVKVVASGNGDETLKMLSKLKSYRPGGLTAMHRGLMRAIEQFDTDLSQYTVSIINMTDGEATEDTHFQSGLEKNYQNGTVAIPIYSIMFGDASSSQLEPIAAYSGGKIFDGRKDLVKAFQEVRGYN